MNTASAAQKPAPVPKTKEIDLRSPLSGSDGRPGIGRRAIVRPMANRDLTTEILIQIRDEMKAVRGELTTTREQLSSRIDETNLRLERVERAQSETEIRLATEIISVVSAVNQLKDLIVADRDLRNRVDEHDRRLAALEHQAS